MGQTIHITPHNSLLSIAKDGKTVVTLKQDCTVEWANGINIDAAAQAFGDSIKLGMEYSLGFDKSARLSYMKAIYHTLIDLCEEKGYLTVEDLTNDMNQYILVSKLRE